jgi:hypothetical protein
MLHLSQSRTSNVQSLTTHSFKNGFSPNRRQLVQESVLLLLEVARQVWRALLNSTKLAMQLLFTKDAIELAVFFAMVSLK